MGLRARALNEPLAVDDDPDHLSAGDRLGRGVPSTVLGVDLEVTRRPSTAVTVARAVTVAPGGVASRWSMATLVPTVVCHGSSPGAAASTVAASHQATTTGVASTGTSPLPTAAARSASVTTR